MKPYANQNDLDLEQALIASRKTAKQGYRLAKKNLKEASSAFDEMSEEIKACLNKIEDGKVRTPEVVNGLKNQLSGILGEISSLQHSLDAELKERYKQLNVFSITLFGRTMAGKSTLMEILTEGNGESIGKGAQRTTRDVRSYSWKGLEVTDVPGVAAFEGSEDEDLAFASASKADLILFLITDDAPQPAEAECLARIRHLGKPVLGICNVKVAVDDEDDLQLFLRNPEKPFDQIRISDLLRQFRLFADQHIPGIHIPFVATHLHSRYLALKPEYKAYKKKLYWASKYKFLERKIIQEVAGRGAFLRIKSFIDGAYRPMLDLSELLLNYAGQNSGSGRVLIGKCRQFREWSSSFAVLSLNRIETLVKKEADALRFEIPGFVEDHYQDGSAGKNWNSLVESRGIDKKIQKIQKSIQKKVQVELSEIARELQTELSLVMSMSADKNIKMDSILNLKRAWNWGVNLVASGLGIWAIIIGSGPIGWAAAAVGVVGWLLSYLFEDREKKATKARNSLTIKLNTNVDKMESSLQNDLKRWFHEELIRDQVNVFLDDLSAVTEGLFSLSDAQRNLAWTLNERQKLLNKALLNAALEQLDSTDFEGLFIDVARAPGLALMIVIPPNTQIPEDVQKELEHLLGEKLWFVIETENVLNKLYQAIGRKCPLDSIGVEEKIRVAHVPLHLLGEEAKPRVRMAQQLTGYHIMQTGGKR